MASEYRRTIAFFILAALAATALPATAKAEPPPRADCPRDKNGQIQYYAVTALELDRLISAQSGSPAADWSCLDLALTDLSGVDLRDANLDGARLLGAKLVDALLQRASFTEANVTDADMTRAELYGATFISAYMTQVDLTEADLSKADLTYANLWGSWIENADLSDAKLSHANLEEANISRTNFAGAEIDYVLLSGATLRSSRWEPHGRPSSDGLLELEEIETLWFCGRNSLALHRLRDQLKAAGLRHSERAATFALESTKTRYLRREFDAQYQRHCLGRHSPAALIGDTVEGWFRYIALELPVGYGLDIGRPWRAIGTVMWLAFAVYVSVIAFPRLGGGLFLVWPADRLAVDRQGVWVLVDDARVERLHRTGFGAFLYGAYFSLLSAFYFGWRDLNVSNWLTKLQPTEFVLRPHGWVRVICGVQALLSLYFLAMWALFYFGRPLQ